MATKKKTTKAKKATVSKKSVKKDAKVVPEQDQSVSEVSRIANQGKTSTKGIVAIIVGIMIIAVVAAATLGERNQEFSELTLYTGDSYSVEYPRDWNFDEQETGIEFFSDELSESSAAGLAVAYSSRIPGYDALEPSQRDELIKLALESVRADDATIQSGFSNVASADIQLAEHPAADRALSFTLEGTLEGGSTGILRGFMIITELGDTYVISSGGNAEVYAVNSEQITAMLNSFAPNVNGSAQE